MAAAKKAFTDIGSKMFNMMDDAPGLISLLIMFFIAIPVLG